MKTKERWKPVPGYERCFISDCGRVWDSIRKMLMKQTKTESNYLTVRIPQYDNPNLRKTLKVHRLVMKAFNGSNDLPVNHKDRNKMNNHISNLEYVTNIQNVHHALVTNMSPAQIVTCHRCNPDKN